MKWTNQGGIIFWKFTNHMASSSQIHLQTTMPNNKEEVNFLTICGQTPLFLTFIRSSKPRLVLYLYKVCFLPEMV